MFNECVIFQHLTYTSRWQPRRERERELAVQRQIRVIEGIIIEERPPSFAEQTRL